MSATRHFRVDPRLVHATLMNAWVPHLGAKKLVIADDRAQSDPRLRKILEMSTMDLVKLAFVRAEGLGTQLASEPPDLKIIVLFAALDAVNRALDSGAPIDSLNIGHLPEAPDRRPVLPAVHLGPKDLEAIGKMRDRGVDVYLQPLPRDPRTSPFAEPQAPKVTVPKDSVSQAPRRSHTPVPHAPKPAEPVKESRVEAKLRVLNERGLHLRAAHALAHLAGTLEEDVQIGLRGEMVNAKSLLGLTTLGAACGMYLDVIVSGANARRSMDAIKELFDRGFDEGIADEATLAQGDEA